MRDKEEYWQLIDKLKAQTQFVIPVEVVVGPTTKYLESLERLDNAVKLVQEGMGKHQAARTAHVGEVRLRRRLKQLEGKSEA